MHELIQRGLDNPDEDLFGKGTFRLLEGLSLYRGEHVEGPKQSFFS